MVQRLPTANGPGQKATSGIRCFQAVISHNQTQKGVVLYAGVPLIEVKRTLQASFGISDDIIGLKDVGQKINFPLSLLSRAPAYFSANNKAGTFYELIIDKKARGAFASDPSIATGKKKKKRKPASGQFGKLQKQSSVSMIFDLDRQQVEKLVQTFRNAAPTGMLDKTTFHKCFTQLMGSVGNIDERNIEILNRLFDIFDRDKNGVVDSTEFLSGLSVLASGDRDDKIRAAFELYDANNDGYISLEEMSRYLTSVFSVIAETNPEVFKEHQVSPQELGQITAKQCFIEADTNGDGSLNFEEFRSWYSKPSADSDRGSFFAAAASRMQEDSLGQSVEQLRHLTGLKYCTVDEMFSTLEGAAKLGTLDRRTLVRSFNKILKKQGRKTGTKDPLVKQAIQRLFEVLDDDRNGVVSVSELAIGLSILCGGSRDEKVAPVFRIFDSDGDGKLSLSELTAYFKAVFKILYEVRPKDQLSATVSADDMAKIMADQAFIEADTNRDGQLSFEEFTHWYLTSGPFESSTSGESSSAVFNREELRRLTNLQAYTVQDVFELFAENANEHGALTRESFMGCFQAIRRSGPRLSAKEREKLQIALDLLFRTFDVGTKNKVDFTELASGLSVLCSGAADEKAEAAFSLFDIDGDGFISMSEMVTYFASVFKVLFLTTAKPAGSTVTPDVVARVTANQAFLEADTNKDGRISFAEFQQWYKTPSVTLPALSFPSESRSSQLKVTSIGAHPESTDWSSLKDVRRLTNLQSYDVRDVFKFFSASANASGNLDRQRFFRCFNKLIQKAGGMKDRRDQEKTRKLLDRLFTIFDEDDNGVIDINELASGLSILCGGSRDEKVKAAFELYDVDGDGFIDKREMISYLTSVYKVLYEASAQTRELIGVHPSELAIVTAEQCFEDADKNVDGKLSFEEFQSWYSLPGQSALAGVSESPAFTMDQVKGVTNLESYSVDEVLEIFAEAVDEDGGISQSAFKEVFNSFMGTWVVNEERFQQVVEKLFNIFDTDRNGIVDFSELASGLTVLCGGSQDDKVRAAFKLYDADGDGYISLDEMTAYLTSVFRVLYVTNPGTLQRIGVGPETLSRITAEQAFHEVDADRDGKLNFQEFQRWYSTGAPKPGSPTYASSEWASVVESVSLDDVREASGLGEKSVEEVFEKFAEAADESGNLSFRAYRKCVESLLSKTRRKASHRQGSGKSTLKTSPRLLESSRQVLDRIFRLFDRNSLGVVDFSELASGISVLCGGTRHHKVQAAFSLYDYDGDGFVSVAEMTRYLTSVFLVLFEVSPQLRESIGTTAEKLGFMTAKQAFEEADTDKDGKLSLEEFTFWYTSGSHASLRSPSLRSSITPKASTQSTPTGVGEGVRKTRGPRFSIMEAKLLTKLDNYDPVDVFEVLAEHADEDGMLDYNAFHLSFTALMKGSTKMPSRQEKKRQSQLVHRLYTLFAKGDTGLVDFSELASGISVLCGGDRDTKVESAFALYDYDGDGFISIEEMTRYLQAVFRVLYEFNAQDDSTGVMQTLGVSSDSLGEIMARQAFAEADSNGDGKLSLEEFNAWYQSSSRPLASYQKSDLHKSKTDATVEVPGRLGIQSKPKSDASSHSSLSLSEVRRLTHLENFSPEEVFEIFAKHSSASDGVLSKKAFFESCQHFVPQGTVPLTPAERLRRKNLLDAIFDLFDQDKNGVVDFSELASGVSILCGGTRDEKVEAAFSLYDYNGDGFVTLDEMTRYLQSVFRVLHQISPSIFQQIGGISPDNLARVTAEQAFEDADINHDGKLSIEEFKSWYANPMQRDLKKLVVQNVPSWVSLKEARRLTNLQRHAPQDVFERFANAADKNGLLSRSVFNSLFRKIIGDNVRTLSAEDKERTKFVVDRLFEVFDQDGNGFVDFSELASGLSVLCGGRRDDKVRLAFNLYDYDGDGFISLKEMARYLTSVFRVLYEVNPVTRERMGVAPEELGQVTAAQAFMDADTNRDGQLSFEEFKAWYLNPTSHMYEDQTLSEDAPTPVWLTLEEARRLTSLEKFAPEDVFEVFALAANTEGLLNRSSFAQCFKQLSKLSGSKPDTAADQDRLSLVIERLFKVFDVDANGEVDFSEVASGISVLCGGRREDKVQAAFSLYDLNGDGFISLEEMSRYLSSVFKVLYELSPELKSKTGVSPEELGAVTAEQAFTEADANQDGKLSFIEFKHWYMSSEGFPAAFSNEEAKPSSPLTLKDIKELTSLHQYAPEDVFEVFALAANAEGILDKAAFRKSFRQLVEKSGRHFEEQRLNDLADQIFKVFDTDLNGGVDFSELASGISVICGGTRDQKVKAAFSLYDINGDGFITLSEMVRYLTAVFKFLYETTPGTAERIGVVAEELALITAQQCFHDADLDNDGKLSFEEFQSWYSRTGGDILGSPRRLEAEAGSLKEKQDSIIDEQVDSLEAARRITKLDMFDVAAVFETFAEAAEDGRLSKEAFSKTFHRLIKLGGGHDNPDDYTKANDMIERLFGLFDRDSNGIVDFNELASGLSVLSGSPMEEKVHASFQLYDIDRDGFISFEEMLSYMTSVFRVMYETSPDIRDKMGVTAEELAKATAEQCFKEADQNNDRKLSFEEFKSWCLGRL